MERSSCRVQRWQYQVHPGCRIQSSAPIERRCQAVNSRSVYGARFDASMTRRKLGCEWTAAPFEPRLTHGDVHVWLAPLDRMSLDQETIRSALSESERTRVAALRSSRHRVQFLHAHFVLRSLLGWYLRTSPRDVQIVARDGGKPALADAPTTTFNMSHSESLAIYAFAMHDEIGVDIQSIRADIPFHRIANRYFTQSEVQKIMRADSADQIHAFFQYWVRKEAALKAAGCGLGDRMSTVDVGHDCLVEQDHVIAQVPGSNEPWHVFDLPTITGYRAALALNSVPRHIACWRVSQCEDVQALTCQ